jgi:peptidoglycan/LPS O-acetylase OafA/YrhL
MVWKISEASLQALFAYPLVTACALAYFTLMLVLAFPPVRSRIGPYLTHPSPPNQQYLYGFDLFRGLAALLVAIGHAWNLNRPIFDDMQNSSLVLAYMLGHASKAVPIFAVLSGFLIFRAVLKIGNLQDLRRYTLRRIFRIYPVYLIGVLLALAFGLYAGDGGRHNAFNFFIADVFMLSPLGWNKSAQVVAWSLYVEEMFYVLLPIVVILLTPRRMLAFAIIGLIVLLMADFQSRVFGLWKYFLFGILASELEPYFRGRLGMALAAFAAGLVLMAVDFRFGAVDVFGLLRDAPSGGTVALGVACLLVLVSISNLGSLSRWLNILPLRMIGAISFSVFITHRFLIHYVFPNTLTISDNTQRFAVNGAVSPLGWWYLPLLFIPAALFVGLVCFLLVERPGVLLGRRLAARLQRDNRGPAAPKHPETEAEVVAPSKRPPA